MTEFRVSVHCQGVLRSNRCDDRHAPCVIEHFSRVDGRWVGLIHDVLGDADPFTRLNGGQRVNRPSRGGVVRTAKGWRFECPACGMNARVSHRLVAAALDGLEAADEGRISLDTLNTLARKPSAIR